MPKICDTRKQRAAVLLERLTTGPYFSAIAKPNYTPRDAQHDYKIWAEAWIIPEVENLVTELRNEIRSELGHLGAQARMRNTTPEQRRELAKKAADVRWRGQFVATCSTCQQPIYESQAHDRCDDVATGCGGYFHDECEHTH